MKKILIYGIDIVIILKFKVVRYMYYKRLCMFNGKIFDNCFEKEFFKLYLLLCMFDFFKKILYICI